MTDVEKSPPTFDACVVTHGSESETLHLHVLNTFGLDVLQKGQLVFHGVLTERSVQTALT